jgi:hypothetical protein
MDEETKNEETNEAGVFTEKNKLNTSNTLLAVIAVLVIMSAVQVFQLQGLVNAISSGAKSASAQTSGGSAVGLPSQVGGCG